MKRVQFSLRTLLLIVLAIAILLFPISSQTMPAWRVRIVDASMKPHVNMRIIRRQWVREGFVTRSAREEVARTDAKGECDFASYRVNRNLFNLLFNNIDTRFSAILVNDTDSIMEEEAKSIDGELRIEVVYPELKFRPY